MKEDVWLSEVYLHLDREIIDYLEPRHFDWDGYRHLKPSEAIEAIKDYYEHLI